MIMSIPCIYQFHSSLAIKLIDFRARQIERVGRAGREWARASDWNAWSRYTHMSFYTFSRLWRKTSNVYVTRGMLNCSEILGTCHLFCRQFMPHSLIKMLMTVYVFSLPSNRCNSLLHNPKARSRYAGAYFWVMGLEKRGKLLPGAVVGVRSGAP